ncbi:MAG: FHA domain-containing protein [Calditrichaeota bacterium]|nr:MAG: FHA domain-containing protein [Calditrichota bacterium]
MKCDHCNKDNFKNVLYCEHCNQRMFRAKVRLVDNSGSDNTLYVFTHDYYIGREPSSEIFLDDLAVSRKHARIYYQDDIYYIENLKSKNGVLVNGEQISHCRLKNYDIIQIGGATLHFYYSEGEFPEDQIISRTGEFLQETLLKISREIQSKNMLDEVLNTILDGLVAMTNANDAMLWLPDDAGDWQLHLSRNLRLFGEDSSLRSEAQNLVIKMAGNAKHYVFHKNEKQEFVENLEEIVGLPYRMLAMALRSRKLVDDETGPRKVLGVIVMRVFKRGRRLDKRKVNLLESLLSQTVVAIENTYLYSEALEKKKINSELLLAEKIQNRLLPRELIKTPKTDMAAFSRAQSYVGGDYYDVLRVSDDALAIAIADIAGKGIGAALVMSSLQGSLRAQISYEQNPEQIVANINQLIGECTAEGLFATFFFCIYNYEKLELKYVNAGHNPPLLLKKDGGFEFFKSSATALGILEENRGKEKTAQLQIGDVVIFYTDGVTEAMNQEMRQLGLEKIRIAAQEFIKSKPKATADEILKCILKRIEEHTEGQQQHDDLTILILKILKK